ncbi:MAG: thiol reductant ABC exporter subunit CydD [Anaerolineales bacterium]|nr:thiol reductant ABC exporter subunit CydD [Anaerolineales bacterium]
MRIDPRLLSQVKRFGMALIPAIGLSVAGGAFVVLQAAWLSRAISGVFLESKTLSETVPLLWGLLGVVLLRAALSLGAEIAANRAATGVKQGLRTALFEHILALGPVFTSSETADGDVRTGELVSTATEGIDGLEAYVSQYLPQVVSAALNPLIILCFILPLDVLTSIVLLVTAPLIPIFMVLIGSAAEKLTRRQWRSLSRMSAFFLDVLQGLPTLKALGRGRAMGERIAAVSDEHRLITMKVLRVTFLSALALELIATLSTAVVAVEIGLRLLYGRIGFEQAFFILILAPEFYLPLRLLGLRFHAGMAGAEAARRIFEILAIQPAEKYSETGPKGGKSTNHPALQSPDIWLEDIHYTYANGSQALQGITLHLPAGKKTALVGTSGAGKSTIASLMLRFITPQRGQILVDGRSLGSIPVEEWRKHLAWVPQNPYLFNDTVAANIRLAKPEASLEEVARAARLAHAESFIRELPEGYDTVIGERGQRLSAGQAQRIALARAFLKDARFLILDEATANLDPDTEETIRQSTDQLAEGRTVLVIAHRLATVRSADQIAVISAGRVEAIGTHQQLLNENEHYQQMVEAYTSASLPMRDEAIPLLPPSWEQPTTGAQEEERSTGHTLLRLLKMILPYWRQVGLSVLLGFAAIASSIGLMATSAWLIARAALRPSIAALQVAIVGVRFFGLARGVFRYLERLASHDATFRLLAGWRSWFYRAIEPLAPARLIDTHSGDLLNRIIGDIRSLENLYVRGIAPPVVAVLSLVACAGFFMAHDPLLALALVSAMLIAGVGSPALILALSRKVGYQLVQARGRLSTLLVDGFQGLPDLTACGQGTQQLHRVVAASEALSQAERHLGWINGLQAALAGLLAHLGALAILTLSIPLVENEKLDGVLLGMLTLAALTSFEGIAPLGAAAQHLQSNLASARRLFEVADRPPAVQPPSHPLPLPSDHHLEVENLSFRYPQDQTPGSETLQDISFTLRPGEHVAIVGPSGAGKTTLMHLLLRFWEFEQGRITLGGQDLHAFEPEALRQRIAALPQRVFLFHATIKDNLRLARPEATQAEIEEAARLAQLGDFIQSLPEGYNTWIGEQGLRLSAGERQRLGLARTLLRRAPLLILDEPTASLDALTETAVLQALQSVRPGIGLLTISHRLSGLEEADEILVLQAGAIGERGRHAELLARDGLYRRMWELQNQVLAI